MCGLVTLFGKNSASLDIAVVDAMLDQIRHRGPDSQNVKKVDHNVIFGHCRLAIIDIFSGVQPISTVDGRFHLVFNGEIYNYKELRTELEAHGYKFRTNSDSEVLLIALQEYGENVFEKINGMFSFVFFDSVEKSWLAARDHFGIKPLYYAQVESGLIFASEIKALLAHPEMKARVDQKSLNQYFSLQFCLSDNTMFSGIFKVEPGYFLRGNQDQINNKCCYWNQKYEIDDFKTQHDFEEELLWLLEDSMRMQMRSDVPVGAYLSGGIDSSLVATLASKYTAGPLPMFHGKFDEGREYDESYFAEVIASAENGLLRQIVPTEKDFVDNLPDLIYSLDEPLAGPGIFPQYMTSQLASQSVKVVLGGQGGDEIFGGYTRYLVAYLEQALKGAITGTNDEGAHVVTLASILPNLHSLKNYTPLMEHFFSDGFFQDMASRYFHLIDRSQGSNWMIDADLRHQLNNAEVFEDFKLVFHGANSQSYINKMTYFDQKTLLPALLQVEDRMSMTVSIESRVPLLDRRIVELVSKAPPPMKFQGGQTKHLLKSAIRHILPDKILDREDKMGFPVPLSKWMSGGIVRDFVADTLLSKKSLERGIFNIQALNELMLKPGVGGRQLWGALSLELWHREFIDLE